MPETHHTHVLLPRQAIYFGSAPKLSCGFAKTRKTGSGL